jgi:hypothetical protein
MQGLKAELMARLQAVMDAPEKGSAPEEADDANAPEEPVVEEERGEEMQEEMHEVLQENEDAGGTAEVKEGPESVAPDAQGENEELHTSADGDQVGRTRLQSAIKPLSYSLNAGSQWSQCRRIPDRA